MYFYPKKKFSWKAVYKKRREILTKMYNRAYQKRRNPTESEAKAWQLIKNLYPWGHLWYSQSIPKEIIRQHFNGTHKQNRCPYYILDFYFPELKLAVEIDGAIHEETKRKDKIREHNLKKIGITTIRFPNNVILKNPNHFTEQLNNIIKAKEATL